MSPDRETNLALFIDFDNVALGARDARQRFDVKLLLQRVLEKGKIIVKKAYADWHYYKEHMSPLHEAAIELIEIPMPRISGKNSADIKLVVDAMDLCYSKDHIDTFVIVSGDSDFSPLVSKLRENNKRVIGIGVKNSSSHLLINNCDEFMFYDDIYRNAVGKLTRSVTNVPADKRDLFDFLVNTAQGLLQESRGVLYSSLIKDTMTRKQPDFNERNYGYSNFGELLEEARRLGLLIVERDVRAGGTWVVQGLGGGSARAAKSADSRSAETKPTETKPAETKSTETKSTEAKSSASGENGKSSGSGGSRSSRRRRSRSRSKAEQAAREQAAADRKERQDEPASAAQDKPSTQQPQADSAKQGEAAAGEAASRGTGETRKPVTRKKAAAGKKTTAKKTTAKKTTARKTTKKTAAKKTAAGKTTTKKTAAKKTTARKATTKKSTAAKAPAKKAAKKTARKTTTRKKTTKKTDE